MINKNGTKTVTQHCRSPITSWYQATVNHHLPEGIIYRYIAVRVMVYRLCNIKLPLNPTYQSYDFFIRNILAKVRDNNNRYDF